MNNTPPPHIYFSNVLKNKKLGFGSLRLPRQNKLIDLKQTMQMIDTFIDDGYLYFEAAYGYNNEDIFKQCLVERYKREDFLLANKMPIRSIYKKEQYYEIFSKSLIKCGVDYFDFYLLHNLGLKDYIRNDHMGCFDFLTELKQKGMVKYIGFSFHDNSDVLEDILIKHYKEIDFVQLQINYLDWNSPVIQSKKCYDVTRKYGLPIFAMAPAKGGFLVNLPDDAINRLSQVNKNLTPIAWSYLFAASLEGVQLVLSGMSELKDVKENTFIMSKYSNLNEIELKALDCVVDIINKESKIQCTQCGYCVSYCPKNIQIPNLLNLYNYVQHFGNLYNRICEGKGKASDCERCGKCETNCPQKIKIHIYMNLIKGIYEKNNSSVDCSFYDKVSKLIVFGAGSRGIEYANNSIICNNILYFIDNDKEKQYIGIKTSTKVFNVYSLEEGLKYLTDDVIILIASPVYKNEMYEQLISLGIKNRIVLT